MIDLVFCNEDTRRRAPRAGRRARRARRRTDARRSVRAKRSRRRRWSLALRPGGDVFAREGRGACRRTPRANDAAARGRDAADTTLAGDTFTSGFLHAYLAGGSLRQCGDAGCAAGAEIVQVHAASEMPTRSIFCGAAVAEKNRAHLTTRRVTSPKGAGHGTGTR